MRPNIGRGGNLTLRRSSGRPSRAASHRERPAQRQLHIKHDYALAQAAGERAAHEARLLSYNYRLLDLGDREILAYHWHPGGISPVTFSHLHLTRLIEPVALGRDREPVSLADMHLPRGSVALADIVRLVITESDVAPLRGDWQDLLRIED